MNCYGAVMFETTFLINVEVLVMNLALTYNHQTEIDPKFKSFIQSGNYEPFILNVMNKSKKIFPNIYKHFNSQSKGESDFIDCVTLQKYDVKLPFTTKQGKLIASRKCNHGEWIYSMLQYQNEFSRSLKNYKVAKVDNLELYSMIKSELQGLKDDEDFIIFIPFPIDSDFGESVYSTFTTDILSKTFDTLARDRVVNNHRIYAIYPNWNKEIVLRCLNKNTREYLRDDELCEYVSYFAELDL